MKFGNLHFLWLIWIPVGMVFFYIWAFRHKKTLIELFVDPLLKERLLKGVSYPRQKLKAAMLVLATLLAILSLIRPKWGFHWEEVRRKGVDIMVALDVSNSMLAQDVSPNRLERAKREILDLLNIIQGDRVGLIAFAGASFLQSPLTLDYGAVKIFLDDLSTDLIPIQGTAVGEAIATAVKSYDQKDKKSRVLILITDGEDHEGNPVEEAKKAAKEGIKIYTIGIGKEGGAPIPDANGGFKKDRNGDMVLTHLDESTLQKVALETGGSYVRSVTGDLDLEKIYQDIHKSVEEKELQSGRRKRFEERFQWPLLLCLLLLFWEVVFPERKRTPRTGLLSILLLGFFLVPSVRAAGISNFFTDRALDGEKSYEAKKYPKALEQLLDAQIERPADMNIKYNLANTYYKMKRYEEAEKLYQSVAANGDRTQSEKALYNLGNVAYKQGKLQEAVDFYQKALEIDPNDEDAKFNLNFVREEIKRRLEENKKRMDQQQQQQGQQQQGQQQDQQQQNQQNQQNQQDQQKQQGQEQKTEEQKAEEKKAAEQNAQKEGQKEEQKDKKDQEGPGASQQKDGQNKEKEQDKKEAAQQGHAKGKPDGKKMDEVEAQRWLESLDEDRKKILQRRLQNSQRYQVEKDW